MQINIVFSINENRRSAKKDVKKNNKQNEKPKTRFE